jgi:hypothetical protein
MKKDFLKRDLREMRKNPLGIFCKKLKRKKLEIDL